MGRHVVFAPGVINRSQPPSITGGDITVVEDRREPFRSRVRSVPPLARHMRSRFSDRTANTRSTTWHSHRAWRWLTAGSTPLPELHQFTIVHRPGWPRASARAISRSTISHSNARWSVGLRCADGVVAPDRYHSPGWIRPCDRRTATPADSRKRRQLRDVGAGRQTPLQLRAFCPYPPLYPLRDRGRAGSSLASCYR